ncbi:hypothetical protein TraAM80_08159 [Trypanosoma rangeli]|uniref:EF-hand domain-containing protein n=1 Tax=Trypanosoma rangeli TaxID=5698 RepID=A0A3R7RC16_TRYRA|nr:uncharacterized protein TraAM80_08159 [Trypanosoma rangeli]RNE99493.1 hypothetical protein TraAM80_08159 [Trypanosoma rangeli]|eukprot:RNE99493.1 hypothetical protein TraAM80_08159 [Trypanosoma rangeli]
MGLFLSKNEIVGVESYPQRGFALLDTEGIHKVSEEALLRRLGTQSLKQSMITMLAVSDEDKDECLNWNEFSNFFRHITGTYIVFAKNTDAYSALESNFNNSTTIPRFSPRRHHQHLYDVKVVNLPSQAGRIRCIAVAPDLDLYAVSHRDACAVSVYTLHVVEVLQRTGYLDLVLNIAFFFDKNYLAAVSESWTVALWDSTADQLIGCVQHKRVVTAVAFSFNGRVLYTGCQYNNVCGMSVPKGALRAVLGELPSREERIVVSLATQHTADDWVVFSRSCEQGACVADAQHLR